MVKYEANVVAICQTMAEFWNGCLFSLCTIVKRVKQHLTTWLHVLWFVRCCEVHYNTTRSYFWQIAFISLDLLNECSVSVLIILAKSNEPHHIMNSIYNLVANGSCASPIHNIVHRNTSTHIAAIKEYFSCLSAKWLYIASYASTTSVLVVTGCGRLV